MDSGASVIPWRRNLVLVAGVFLTVVTALMMSQLDSLRTRLLPTPEVVVVEQVAEVVFTSTPFTAITKPTDAPTQSDVPGETAVPASATAVDTPTSVPPSSTPLPTIAPSETAVSDTPQPECGTVPATWVVYQIQRGDTLFALSRRSGTDMAQVRQANCLTSDDLVSGTQIFLPIVLPTPVVCHSSQPPLWESYTVVRGDTIYKLATSRSVAPSEIQEANCMFGDRLPVGVQIFLPPASLSGTPPSVTAVPGEPTATAIIIPTIWQISSPGNGETVSGILPIIGTASFGSATVQYYKIEITPADGSQGWITLGGTHDIPVINGRLEMLNAAGFEPGDYFLRLVIIENSNYAGDPYTIQITVE